MERTIKEQKNKLLKTGAKDHWDTDEDCEMFWETEGSPVNEQDYHLDDWDLEYIDAILNSFSRQGFNHKKSNGLKLESFIPGDALMRALAPIGTPQEINLKFNQNPTSCGSKEENFSYFSNVEEKGPTELGNYFSDDEDDDSWDEEDLSSESDPWSQTDFYDHENFPNPVETINEASFEYKGEAINLNGISCLSEETKLAFSTWQPFIPPGHAF
jgi:hypothetical protein